MSFRASAPLFLLPILIAWTLPSLKAQVPPVAGAASASTAVPDVNPKLREKAQKEMGKAMMALRKNDFPTARIHLDILQRLAPDRAEVSFLLGLYASETGDAEHAKSYWLRTLELEPQHFRALLSLCEMALRERNFDEAQALAQRAVQADPSSWRAHAILASVYSETNRLGEAVQQAERADELGQAQAAVVEPMLAKLLARKGDKKRAIDILQRYVREHAADDAAMKQLVNIEKDDPIGAPELVESSVAAAASALPPSGNWLPADVDEEMPPVESGAACDVAEILRQTGKRTSEFVGNLDRYTATESVSHVNIDKWGMPAPAQTRKFDYVVSVEEVRQGIFDVYEYRNAHGQPGEFPGGIATLGTPAMALIFHPRSSGNFDMVCEGLTRWDGVPVWQIHFRQRPDKPNTLREYKMSEHGPSYPVAMKGRAWIATANYQIVRLETDLVMTIPEIRLLADHTIIEYGPVHFRQGGLDLWLPQTAEVFFDWNGRRVHRRHSFSNYLLFSVDEKQKISKPKTDQPETSDGADTVDPIAAESAPRTP